MPVIYKERGELPPNRTTPGQVTAVKPSADALAVKKTAK
jgi:hypothetical protein